MLSEPNLSYKPFWGICRPLNSWRANSPNPIQICCAMNNHRLFFFYKFLMISSVNCSVVALPPRSGVNTLCSSNTLFKALRILLETTS